MNDLNKDIMTPSGEQVRAQLKDMLAHPLFVKSGRLRIFLQYIVEKTLCGEADELKEVVLGIEVCKRKPDYDPRIDPVVRVEARRLRKRLEQYYKAVPESKLVIGVPKGGYVPTFSIEEELKASVNLNRLAPRYLIGLMAIAALIALSLWIRDGRMADAGPKSLLVVPFVNVSDQDGDQYFSDGLTDEFIDTLGALPQLAVLSRSTSYLYRGPALNLEELGRELAVDWVLEGSVRKSDQHVRISVRLVDVPRKTNVFSRTFEGDYDNIFDLQRDIANEVMRSMRVKLEGSAPLQSQRFTEDVALYDLYLKANFELNRFSARGVSISLTYLEQILERDPNYLPALSMTASIYSICGAQRFIDPKRAFPKARAAAHAALAADPDSIHAHVALGIVAAMIDWNWQQAETHFERALALDPKNVNALCHYAIFCLLPQGRTEQAKSLLDGALAIDPNNFMPHIGLSHYFLITRQYEHAVASFEATLDISDQFRNVYYDMGFALSRLGRMAEAEEAFMQGSSFDDTGPLTLGASELFLLGRKEEAIKAYNRMASDDHPRPVHLAWAASIIGRHDDAFRFINQAFEEGETELIWLKVHVGWDNIRSDPRYLACLKTLNLGQ